MMKSALFLLTCVALHAATSVSAAAVNLVDVVLNHKVMELTNYTAYLSALAYTTDPEKEADMEYIHNFIEEPDQALVVKAHGYCFGVFRGTTLTWDDWSQNLEVGYEEVCDPDAKETTCCTTRSGFYHAYDTVYRSQVEEQLKECAKTCDNKDECVVLTGHSQGGAVAAVAGVALASLNPYVITFGQPPTILAPCERITSERWYRWVNTKDSETLNVGISYDPVPFVPGLGADFFGHMIIISSDNTGVAYIGLNAQESFGPLNVNGFEAHNMFGSEQYPGYADRVKKLMEVYDAEKSQGYPVRDDGFIPGSYCTEDIECEDKECARETGLSWARCVGTDCDEDQECDSDRCDSGLCIPKLGSCQVCDEHSDCASGVCSWRFRCAETEAGLMGDQCQCNINSDCVSGRCEGTNPPICEAKLAIGGTCNEASDCISDHCNWDFECRPAEEKQMTQATNFFVIIGIVVAVILLCCCVHKCYWNRRRGYEEIPSRVVGE